jgi:hypothetical protein
MVVVEKTASPPVETKTKRTTGKRLNGTKIRRMREKMAVLARGRELWSPDARWTNGFLQKKSHQIFFFENRNYFCPALAETLSGEMGEWLKPPVC